jgi:hypothetical protein
VNRELEQMRLKNKANLLEVAKQFLAPKNVVTEEEEDLVAFLKDRIDDNDMGELQDKLQSVFGRKLNFSDAVVFRVANIKGYSPPTGKGKVTFLQLPDNDILVLGIDVDDKDKISVCYRSDRSDFEIRNEADATIEQIAEYLSYHSVIWLEDLIEKRYDDL